MADQNDNHKIIDEKFFYVPKGSSVPKVENKVNNQNCNEKENTITEKSKETKSIH